jgi:hypothetical protein
MNGREGDEGDEGKENGDDSAAKESEAELQRRRETKWLDMLGNWDDYMMRNYKKVRERCRKGIPSSVRGRAWMHLCGAKHHMAQPQNKTEFKRLYVSSRSNA